VKIPRDTHYSKLTSPRAWAPSSLILVPPEVWKDKTLHRLPLRDLVSLLNRSREAASAFRLGVEQLRLDGGSDLIQAHPKGGRYTSSVHSEMPVPADIQQMLDRMAAKARDRGRGG